MGTHLSINPFIKRALTCTRALSVSTSLSPRITYTNARARPYAHAPSHAHNSRCTVSKRRELAEHLRKSIWTHRQSASVHGFHAISARSSSAPYAQARRVFWGTAEAGPVRAAQRHRGAQRSQVGHFHGRNAPRRSCRPPAHMSVSTAVTARGA